MLDVVNLKVQFLDRLDKWAVNDISFHMDDGEILGLVGESGSGKSVTAMAISGLLVKNQVNYSGSITLNGVEMLNTDREKLREIQGTDLAVVFQEPMNTLDPIMKVGPQIEEALRVHYPDMPAEEMKAQALQAMRDSELYDVESLYDKYPFELSGGMLQRACIAAAIISKPKLLIADEPTTALDVTTQAHIIDLLRKINKEHGTAIMLISHNLAVVHALCDSIVVMKSGKIVEQGDMEEVYSHPQHPYTQNLLASIPTRDKRLR